MVVPVVWRGTAGANTKPTATFVKRNQFLLVGWCADKQGSTPRERAALNTGWSLTRPVTKSTCLVVISPQLTHHRSQKLPWAEDFCWTDGDAMVSARLPYGKAFLHLLWPSLWREGAALLALSSCLACQWGCGGGGHSHHLKQFTTLSPAAELLPSLLILSPP